jgi:hypothetical protein
VSAQLGISLVQGDFGNYQIVGGIGVDIRLQTCGIHLYRRLLKWFRIPATRR